ncbi:MAG TPA: trypsin-like peptidase domain-containing protein [Myxococcota bacterium]|nr:trypsin-like peptidase domain-containing protein [Myxococcota bacterium]
MWRGCTLLGAMLVALAARAEDPFLRRTAAVEAVQSAGPAVVTVMTEQIARNQSPFRPFAGDPFFDRFFHDFFEPRSPGSVESLGSGVVIDAAGHVLTNEHVVARATRIRVSFADGREFDATLLGADPNNDIAALSIQTNEKLPWIAPGTSSDLMVGEPVIAIGNPFGLSHTVTTGVISALERSIRAEDRVYHGFIQTDASINPGNSGGPLLNAEGKLIGINTAVYSGAQGIGFAIPIDVARRIVSELIAHGEVSPVWLGLEFQDLTPELRSALSLPAQLRGALVNRIRDPSPAAQAGVARGDVLTRVDGQVIESARDFYERLGSVTNGQELSLSLYRDGHERVVKAHAEEIPPTMVSALVEQLTGMRLTRSKQGIYTVAAVREGSGADRIGVQEGDLLLAINGRALADAASLRRSVVSLRGESRALIVVQRGNGRYQVAIPLG